ncbi:MAG: hypothetical protein WC822_01495 [Candidatus Paceibacterota bacterium]
MQQFDPKVYPNLAKLDEKVRDLLLSDAAKTWDTPEAEYQISRVHPIYWMEQYGRIKPAKMELGSDAALPEGGVVPFTLNPLQLAVADKVCSHLISQKWTRVQMIILKHRKVGTSTLFAAFDYWFMRFVENLNAFVIADLGSHTDNIMEMIRTFHKYDSCGMGAANAKHRPPLSRPMPRNKSGFRLSNGSMVEQDSGENSNPGTSGTINLCHASESSKWRDPDNAETSLLNSIPRSGFAFIVKESTAYGMNKFAQDCEEAERGKSAWDFCFLSWLNMPDCEDEYIEGEPIDLTAAEKELMSLYPKMRMGHIKFRRRQIETLGDESKFRQDFPLNSREPFLVTGANYFSTTLVQARIDEVRFYRDWKEHGLDGLGNKYPDILNRIKYNPHGPREVLARFEDKCSVPYMAEFHRNDSAVSMVKNLEGKTNDGAATIFRSPMKGRKYIVAVDVAEGKGQDDSIVEVFDCWMKEQVAEWGGSFDEELTADYAVMIAKVYNNAIIVPEMNNKCGGLLWGYLEQSGYRNLYKRTTITGNKRKQEPGWETKIGVKKDVYGQMKIDFKNGDCLIHSLPLLDQMLTLMDIQGKLEAAEGHKDDRVSASAIALKVITITPTLKDREVVRELTPDMGDLTSHNVKSTRYGEDAIRRYM